ncbi:MAG: DUF4382 domain-containing protein [archaeon]
MNKFIVIGLISLILLFAGCVDPFNPPKPEQKTGNLLLSITDKEVEGLEKLDVTISSIEVHRISTENQETNENQNSDLNSDENSGNGNETEQETEQNASWIVFSSEEKTFDLMALKSSEGLKALLGEKQLDAGKYTQIRLAVKEVKATINGETFDVEVPSDKIKLVRNFSIEAGKTTELVIDFSPESVIKTGNTYKLKPVIKILAEKEFNERRIEKPGEKEIDFSLIEQGTQSGVTEKGFEVANSPEELIQIYTKIYLNQSPVPELPIIDFESKTVIAVFLGEKFNPKYSLNISKVMLSGKQLTIFAQEIYTEPDEGTAITQITVQPFAVISVEKTDKVNVVWNQKSDGKQNFCEQASDCGCGVDTESRECFFGNKEFVDETQQCPDFCSGIGGNLAIKCIEKKCVQVSFMKLSKEQAREIALESECIQEGQLKENTTYNENSKTWWIDLNVKKQGCNPACVVSEETGTAEINWRCTGLIPE